MHLQMQLQADLVKRLKLAKLCNDQLLAYQQQSQQRFVQKYVLLFSASSLHLCIIQSCSIPWILEASPFEPKPQVI